MKTVAWLCATALMVAGCQTVTAAPTPTHTPPPSLTAAPTATHAPTATPQPAPTPERYPLREALDNEHLAPLATAHEEWAGIYVEVTSVEGTTRFEHHAWVDQPNRRYHSELVGYHPVEATEPYLTDVRISDGEFSLIPSPADFETKVVAPVMDGTFLPPVEQHTPNTLYSTWVNGQLGNPASNMIAPMVVAQNLAYAQLDERRTDTLLGRPVTVLTFSGRGMPLTLWVDDETGILLRLEEGSGVRRTVEVTALTLEPAFPQGIFYVDHDAYDPALLQP